ncbi:ParM/StbA family protein [Ktedonosporobacter rubrisoli]|uniref:ParM/StbA family protein n=1 Tax=Ktedonosporobacter rubrisoli TaxID=2509675 RepID=A0A4P6K4T8_KTERU|nr:ParM/StbA family protein [Ktedonosporobacter rubrisoli]QBD83269.1 ParM/StbA family protein [Ktedonosporobacter rubrisoli]
MKWYAYGHDFGNSEIGGAVHASGATAPRTMSIPTAVAKVDVQAMRSLGVQINGSEHHLIHLEGDEFTYAIGDLALLQGGRDIWNGRSDISRYASKHSLRGLLTVASSLITDREFGLAVVAGLPTETFVKNPQLREQIKKQLSGTYTFSTDQGKSWRKAVVEIEAVVMEGAGALIYYGEKDNKKDTAVIDIGGRTTDLYVSRGQVPLIELCRGKAIGVESAALLLKESCEQKYDCTLSDLETRQILRAYLSGEKGSYPEITVYGKAVSPTQLAQLSKHAVEEVGQEILSFVAAAWNENEQGKFGSRFRSVLNIGGGVFYFHRLLKERIPHLSRPSDPVHANALGYCTLAGFQLKKRKSNATATA